MANSIVRFGLKGKYFSSNCLSRDVNSNFPDNATNSPQKLENFKVQIQKLEHAGVENSKNNHLNENVPDSNYSNIT